jgi:hypothetical protein
MVHTGNQSGSQPKQEAPCPLTLLRCHAVVPTADLLDYHDEVEGSNGDRM